MILMYDGKYYSEDEIKTVSPELYEYRLHHETLEETLTVDEVKSNTTRWFTAVYILFSPAFLVLFGYGLASDRAVFENLGIAFLLGVPVTLYVWVISEWQFYRSSKWFPRTVRIQNDVVHVSVPGSVTKFTLDGRPVFPTRAPWTDQAFPYLLPRKCFLIRYNFGNSVAVGLKSETFPVFDGFFRLIQSDSGKSENS